MAGHRHITSIENYKNNDADALRAAVDVYHLMQ